MTRTFRIAASLAGLLVSEPARAQMLPPPAATISVTGSAEIDLKPDFARLFVAVVTTGDTISQATEANRAATERVLTRLRALSVTREDIRTTDLQVGQTPPRTDRDGREVRVPRFSATHRLQVTTRDLDGVGRLAGEVLSVGDLTFQSLAWGVDRQDQNRDDARRAAIHDGRRQAEVYAEAAGVKLVRIMEIRDTYAGDDRDRLMQMRGAAEAPALAIVPPATVRAAASVQMVWEIAPAP